MAALKQSMESKGRAMVRDAVRRRMGKPQKEELPTPRGLTATTKPAPDGALRLILLPFVYATDRMAVGFAR